MRQIRQGVFETNSSSVHTLTMCTKSDYDKWERGEVYLNESWLSSSSPYKDKKFVTKEEAIDILKHCKYCYAEADFSNEEEFEETLREAEFYMYDDYGADFEWFSEGYITPGGEHIIAFGYTGYDG